jgi:HK97 family phage major capsid protein
MDAKIKELQEELLDLNERATVMQATADAEKRSLSEDEKAEMKQIFARSEEIEEDIATRNQIAAQTNKLMQGEGRSADPQQPEPQGLPEGEAPQVQNRVNAPKNSPRQPRIYMPEERGKWGWKNMGEFAMSVRQSSAKAATVDPRLVMNAPTTYSSEGVGSDGGFLVPPDFRTEIWSRINNEASLFGMTDQNITGKNQWVIPADETTPWDTTNGVQAYFESEAGQLTQSKMALVDKTVRLNKLTSLVPVTDELMEDAPGLDSYLRKKVAEKMDFKLTLKIVQGTGAGEPLGILGSNSLVSVAKEAGQDADTILAENISKMWNRMYAPYRLNAVWLINQSIEPQLDKLSAVIGTGGVPLYMPSGGLSAAPYSTIKGRPVIPTQACETLGDKGDIIFVNLKEYLSVYKSGGMRTDISMHLWFDYDVLAYRFIIRIGGQPWWAQSITPRDNTDNLSWAVTLDERA